MTTRTLSIPYDVWNLPADASPGELNSLVQRLCAADTDEAASLAFDIARGLYWHCSDWHSGQWSERYSILSTMGYKPGYSETQPSEDEEGDEAALYVYQMLETQMS